MKTQKQRIFSILAILSLVVILSFIFVACNSKGDQSSEKPDMEATEIYKSVDPSVAFLLVQKKDGSYASGSGFFIDPHGTLVTNYHVIEDGIKCAVQMKNGKTVEVKTVVSYDEDADLAILATKVANTKPITESKSLPQVGETVYAIGYPEAFKLGIASSTFTSGIVSSYRTMDGNEYIQSTVNITHGNSGGVLINKKGDVVGITSSGITYGDIDYMNLSIPISKIHNLAVESNEPLDVVTARHYPVFATFYALDLVFDKQELDYENTAYYPGIVQREGYTFDGWYADKAFTQEWDFSTQITKDTAIFAKLDPIYFSLNLDLNGGVWASNNPGDKYYIKNCEKALPIPKKTGYMFDGWTDSNGNYIDNYPSYSNARTLTLTANWVEGTPGLTFQLNDDSTATVTACDKSKSNIVIPTIYRGHNVTSIASSAFADCKSLQTVTISEHVSNIGSYAFDNCTALKSVVWKPTEKITFGSYVFRNCTNINLIIDDSVTYIAGGAFQYRTWFSSITIPDSVTSIGYEAFRGCTGLTSITIPDSVTSIGNSAFYDCSGLTSIYYTGNVASWCGISGLGNLMTTSRTLYIGGNKVDGNMTIPDGVTSVGRYAFYGCSDLTSVTIGNSVTTIGYSAFRDCSGLTSVTIGNSVTSIGSYAFSGCSGLTSVTIGNSVTSIDNGAFYGCSGLTSITIPDSVTSIGDYAFRGCSSLTSMTLPFVGASATASNGYNQVFGYIFGYTKNNSDSYSAGTYQYKGDSYTEYYHYYIPSSIKSVTITGGKIPYHAFYNCSKLTNVTIGDSVTSIGNSAFYNCSSLTSIYYTGNVAGWCGISGLGNLMSASRTLYIGGNKVDGNLTIPDGVTSIPAYAFYGCNALTSITIPDSVTTIGYAAFHGCSGLTSMAIPDSVTSIGNYAFYNCTSLSSVTIGNSVTSIGIYAFYGCGGLSTVNWNATACTSAGSSSYPIFGDCSNLTTINIGDNVTTIPSYAFYNCHNLTSITIPDSVTSIGSYSFYGCSGLTSVTIGNSVTSIGESAFSWCTGLTSITIPDSVTYIGSSVFYNCEGLTSVIIGNGLTHIGHGAFFSCTYLTSITIGNSVMSIGGEAFRFCSGLKTVFYAGTEEQWKSIPIDGTTNGSLASAKRYYYREERPTTTGNYWHYDEDGVTPVIWD